MQAWSILLLVYSSFSFQVLEETGFDITHLIDKQAYLEHYFNDQLIRLYIITGIPPNVKFHPKTRKEIKVSYIFFIV